MTQHAALKKAVLWEPLAAFMPNRSAALYIVTSEVRYQSAVIDTVRTTIGIRGVVHDPVQGLLLNDRPVKVKGMCNHQDFAGVGTAVPDRLQTFRVQQMVNFGVNGAPPSNLSSLHSLHSLFQSRLLGVA